MKTLGLGIITRNCEFDLLDKALASVFGHVDNIYITVADQEPADSNILEVAKKYSAHVSSFKWINDFSAARNFNMSHCEDDWYTWMDTDDTVEGMDKAKIKINSLNDNIAFVIATYNYAFYPSGNVMTKHPKERFFRNDGTFTWKGRLHETCVSEYQADGAFFEEVVWNHHTNDDRSLASSKRNVSIIESEIEEQAKSGKLDPRTVFNLGMAYASIAQRTMDGADWIKSVRAFYNYIQIGGWNEHAYMAWKFIGYGQQCMDRLDLALQSYFEALKIQPAYADAYASIGSAYDRMNDLDKAEVWYRLALTEGRDNAYAHDVGLSTITPLVSLARIYGSRGKLDDAEKYANLALQISGSDVQVEGMLGEIKQIRERLKRGTDTVERLRLLSDEEAKDEWSKLPEEDKVLPEVVKFRRSKRWKKETNGKELVIFTGQSWEEWNPDSANTGIGGSEEAVINMAKEFKSLGWTVTVYGNHGPEPKEYEGIWYRPWWDFGVEEPMDIFVGWRDPGVFEFKMNAKKTYLWLHDTVPANAITTKRLANITKVITLSQWHRELYPNIPDEKMYVSRNGIIPSQFKRKPKKTKGRVVYTSAPDRGLECLLKLWPRIKERVPEAELYWAYGWQTYDKIQASNPLAKAWKDRMLGLLKQPGVHELGRIGHEPLAELMQSAVVWAYPTEFTEISCITAMKMQAAEVTPVCTAVAALNETVQFGFKLDVKDIYTNVKAQNQFIDYVVDVLSNGYQVRDGMGQWARKFFGWNQVAKEWDEEFNTKTK